MELSSIKKCDAIDTNGEYAILYGSEAYIFHKSGKYVARIKLDYPPLKAAFLANDRALLCATDNRSCCYLSLKDGSEFWRLKKPKVSGIGNLKFAVSPDQKIVYDVYRKDRRVRCDIICPEEQIIETVTLPKGYRVNMDFSCDSDNVLRVVQYQGDEDPLLEGEEYPSTFTCKWCVIEVPRDEQPRITTQWEERGISDIDAPRTPHREKYCDGYILWEDMTVEDLRNKRTFDLLANDTMARHRFESFCTAYDRKRNYLTVTYLSSNFTQIIDCTARKRVAQYAKLPNEKGYGCLVGDEYWVGTNDGVIRRPFPHMDEIPERYKAKP